jgi:DNA-binding winged helix-turn-helix (wHTH) protein/predicted ATPase
MRKARYIRFEPFRLDVLDERLWERDKGVPLGRKAFAVLQRLVSQPGQLVTKDELLAAAWPDTAVSDAVLTTAMREIRQALGDPAQAPRFVETVHGRGYRFVAPVAETDAAITPEEPRHHLVGREAEWGRLREWYAAVQHGTRRIGFVAGEAGIGKTALVEAFVSELARRGTARVARGQCIEHYGAGEAYLPILEALGRLGRDTAAPVADVLRRYAPTWLTHLPSLRSGGVLEAAAAVTPARMLRELADALEILTVRDPLILILEDLHWSDTATLEWLAYTARRRDPARLLVMVTYRPVEALLYNHPLRGLIAELRQHPQCAELVLDCLSRDSVETYVRQRCGSIPGLEELVAVLCRRTGGHPLFLTTIVDELTRQTSGLVAMANVVPTSVRQFIEHRFEQLSGEDKDILEAASVVGDPFSIAVIAAAMPAPEERIEARCAAWVHEGQFLTPAGAMTWPDGTLAARYGFRHALYQEVVYAGISPERRARLHRRAGDRLEGAYGKRAATVAAELAVHFEHGRDPSRAVSYLEQAARNALDRSAYSEARRHLERGQKVLEALPEGRERLQRELEFLLLLGRVLMTTKGWGGEEVERVFFRARELCEELGDMPRLLQTIWGMICVSFVRAEIRQTQTLAGEVLALAVKLGDPVYEILAHMELGGTAFHLGEPTSATPDHFRKVQALYNPCQHRTHIARFGADLGVFSCSWGTHFYWHAGYPDQACAQAGEILSLAGELSHPFSLAIALAYAAMLHQFRRDLDELDRLATATMKHTAEHGFPYYLAWAEVLRGWSRAAHAELEPRTGEEGLVEIRRGIQVLHATAGVRLPYYRALLAEACGWTGHIDEAFQTLDDALAEVRKTEERCWEPELHRLRGELLRGKPVNRHAEAEECFHKAIEAARGQNAKSLELRAAVSLGRLWRDEGRRMDARRLLAEIYGWFTEGFDTPDLREAKALLEQLAS